MKRFKQSSLILAALTAFSSGPGARAGTFTSDFNSGTDAPPGTTVNGTTVIESTGGVDNSGALKLTKAINGQAGSFVIDDLDAGNPIYGFDLTTKIRLGGGTSTPADGFSINIDPTASSTTQTGEEGTAGGITFAFDLYDNGSEVPPAPSIDFKVGGVLVVTHKMSIADFDTGADYVDLHAQITADGAMSLAYKGNIIFTNVYFDNYQALSAAPLVIGGRTGGANENQFFDNLTYTTYTQPKVGITSQPLSQTVLPGSTVTFASNVSNPDGATFQWFKGTDPVTGGTTQNLTVPNVSIADSGSTYKLVVTGANNTVTSQVATLTVKDITTPSTPTLSFNFDDGNTPAGTALFGLNNGAPDTSASGYITTTGGVGDSGVLHLTDALNGVLGAILIDDPAAGAPVYGLTAEFDALVGGGSVPPADGFSFNYASDIPDDPTVSGAAEDGIGTGLTVGFDIYDNGGGEAPSIDVRYGGQLINQVKLPLSAIETGADFAHVIIHLDTDGTIDVAYNGVIIDDNVTIPGFSSITGGRAVLVGRTGGLNENIWIDNLEITPALTSGDLRVASDPASQTVIVGKPATFTVAANDPTGVSYSWTRDGNPISGATSASYTIPITTLADSGAVFKATVTKGNLSATSAAATLSVANITAPANPTVSYNFDDGATPANTVLAGTLNGAADNTTQGYITTDGGVNGSGVLHLTDAVNGAAGAFIVEPLLGGAEVSTFSASVDVRIGGGSNPPADGFSINFASDLSEAAGAAAEDGSGTGLTVGFDVYDNGAPPTENVPAPSIDLHWKGQIVATVQKPWQQIETGDAFKTLLVNLSADGKVSVSFGDDVLFNNVQLPNYTPITAGKIGLYARTGGLNDNFWVDNLAIGVTKTAVFKFTQEPLSASILEGQPAKFSVLVSDPTGATFSWYKNGNLVSAGTSGNYTTPALTTADNGAVYTVKVSGPNGDVTSDPATITVIPLLTISNPNVNFDFEDGNVPDGTELNASAGGGYIDSGVLHLTDAINGEGGTFVVHDLNAGTPVTAFTAHARILVGGGSAPPADGFSFCWVNDLPAGTIFGEDGSGTGLIISFDIYDNGNETPPAPSIDARYNGVAVATVHLPYQSMESGSDYTDLYIRVESDGTLDLQYNNMAIFTNVQLPNYTPLTGADFAIGARTGGLNENQWLDSLAIATSTQSTPPSTTVHVAKNADGKITLTWDGAGTLVSSTSVNGPYTAVTGAASGIVITPSDAHVFYQVAQ